MPLPLPLSPLSTLVCVLPLKYSKPLTVISKPVQLLFPLPETLTPQVLFECLVLTLQSLAPNSFAQKSLFLPPNPKGCPRQSISVFLVDFPAGTFHKPQLLHLYIYLLTLLFPLYLNTYYRVWDIMKQKNECWLKRCTDTPLGL